MAHGPQYIAAPPVERFTVVKAAEERRLFTLTNDLFVFVTVSRFFLFFVVDVVGAVKVVANRSWHRQQLPADAADE